MLSGPSMKDSNMQKTVTFRKGTYVKGRVVLLNSRKTPIGKYKTHLDFYVHPSWELAQTHLRANRNKSPSNQWCDWCSCCKEETVPSHLKGLLRRVWRSEIPARERLSQRVCDFKTSMASLNKSKAARVALFNSESLSMFIFSWCQGDWS